MKHIILSLALSTLLATSAAAALSPADQKAMSTALGHFQKGAYAQAISAAEKVRGTSDEAQRAKALFLASAHAKNQAFDSALPHYKRALELKAPSPSLNFEYGQALFAARQLKEAEEQFRASIVAKYKMGASAYYIAHIRQLLEDPAGARDYYLRIQRMSADDDQVKQPALLQLAELANEATQAEANKARRIARLRSHVMPLYERARDFARDTPSYDHAMAKLNELAALTGSSAGPTMRNGTPIPRLPYILRLSQDISWDSNVITEADGTLLAVSDKDSFISRTSVFGKYQWNWRRTLSVLPEFYGSLQMHGRRKAPRVYQNDNYTLAPALRTRFEHTSRGKPATGIFDVEFNLMMRDYAQAHKFPFFSRYWNVIVGERVRWFKTGTTTLRLSLKMYEQYTTERNSLTPQVQLEQAIRLSDKLDLLSSFTADYLRARNDFNDERNFKLRHSVTLSKLFERVDFTPTLTLTLKDTMKQKGTRGNELMVNPSLLFSRPLSQKFDSSFEYSFTKNYSKSKDQYQYTKHELKLGASYNF